MKIDIKTADGADIEVGEVYYDDKGVQYLVTGIRISDYRYPAKSRLSCFKGEGDNRVYASMRPGDLYGNAPDSWERLEEDIDRAASRDGELSSCKYFGYGEFSSCEGCRAGMPDTFCEAPTARDILARTKKLAGVE